MSKYAEYTTEEKLIDIIIEETPETKPYGYAVKYYCEFVYNDFKVSGYFFFGTISCGLKKLNKYHFHFNSEFLISTGGCEKPSVSYAPIGKDLFSESKHVDKVEKVGENEVLLYIGKGKDKIKVSLENKYIEYLEKIINC